MEGYAFLCEPKPERSHIDALPTLAYIPPAPSLPCRPGARAVGRRLWSWTLTALIMLAGLGLQYGLAVLAEAERKSRWGDRHLCPLFICCSFVYHLCIEQAGSGREGEQERRSTRAGGAG